MYKKKITSMVSIACLITLALSSECFAYTTDTTVKSYGVSDNGVFTEATTEQKNVINAMRKGALYKWSYDGTDPYVYNQKEAL